MTKKFVVFSDFDGTITTQDTGNVIIDSCIGTTERERLDATILDGTRSFRDANNEMWSGVRFTKFQQAIDVCVAQNVSHDPGFKRFHSILAKHNVTLKVVSAGLTPIVELYLKGFENVEIFANTCTITEVDGQGHWTISYVDDTPSGHDKGAPIRKLKEEYKAAGLSEEERPRILFIGDGLSDLNAARDADFVFAKKGKDLETYCKREGIENVVIWEDFHLLKMLVWNTPHPLPGISTTNFTCEPCLKGHRSSSCNHWTRVLVEVKGKGRPSTQCSHCRTRRSGSAATGSGAKAGHSHHKCLCGLDALAATRRIVEARFACAAGAKVTLVFSTTDAQGLSAMLAASRDSQLAFVAKAPQDPLLLVFETLSVSVPDPVPVTTVGFTIL
ncbi:hypothetical protein HDU98_000147 [Podochytrium sp. JEL0797]|nr:hypothetical protein HDU98_000147 [Podochytrium sp. JEL0797]